MSLGLWLADIVTLKRALPAGTVGGRIAETHIPLAFKNSLAAIAADEDPMMIGCIGVVESPSFSGLEETESRNN